MKIKPAPSGKKFRLPRKKKKKLLNHLAAKIMYDYYRGAGMYETIHKLTEQFKPSALNIKSYIEQVKDNSNMDSVIDKDGRFRWKVQGKSNITMEGNNNGR